VALAALPEERLGVGDVLRGLAVGLPAEAPERLLRFGDPIEVRGSVPGPVAAGGFHQPLVDRFDLLFDVASVLPVADWSSSRIRVRLFCVPRISQLSPKNSPIGVRRGDPDERSSGAVVGRTVRRSSDR